MTTCVSAIRSIAGRVIPLSTASSGSDRATSAVSGRITFTFLFFLPIPQFSADMSWVGGWVELSLSFLFFLSFFLFVIRFQPPSSPALPDVSKGCGGGWIGRPSDGWCTADREERPVHPHSLQPDGYSIHC